MVLYKYRETEREKTRAQNILYYLEIIFFNLHIHYFDLSLSLHPLFSKIS